MPLSSSSSLSVRSYFFWSYSIFTMNENRKLIRNVAAKALETSMMESLAKIGSG